ncbi:MAG: response regulator, partial [Firmicutes bacterium]|nr:response regulator [Bacillota bacterium]
MLGKRNVMTLIMFAGIVFLAGAVFFLVSANSTSLKNGTLDLSEWDGQHAIALVGKAEFSQDELMLQQTSKSPEQDNLVNFPPSRNYYEIRKKHVPGMEKGTYLIHVTGAKPDQTLALRIPPYLLTYRIYIDGKLAEPRDKNEAAEDGSVSRYEVETFEFIPAHESFNIAIQLSHSDYPFSVGYSAFYLGNVGQIERINSVICGYDIFVIAFLLVIVFYNVFYYFLRKDLFFIIFVLMCLMMIGRTLISGSFLISSVLSNPGPRTALYIDYFTAFFLPVSWLSITYLSN